MGGIAKKSKEAESPESAGNEDSSNKLDENQPGAMKDDVQGSQFPYIDERLASDAIAFSLLHGTLQKDMSLALLAIAVAKLTRTL